MKKQLTGEIEVSPEIILLDPIMEMKWIHYDMVRNEFDLEVTYREAGGIYQWGYSYHYINNTPGQLTIDMVINEILNSTLEDNQIVKMFMSEGIDV